MPTRKRAGLPNFAASCAAEEPPPELLLEEPPLELLLEEPPPELLLEEPPLELLLEEPPLELLLEESPELPAAPPAQAASRTAESSTAAVVKRRIIKSHSIGCREAYASFTGCRARAQLSLRGDVRVVRFLFRVMVSG